MTSGANSTDLKAGSGWLDTHPISGTGHLRVRHGMYVPDMHTNTLTPQAAALRCIKTSEQKNSNPAVCLSARSNELFEHLDGRGSESAREVFGLQNAKIRLVQLPISRGAPLLFCTRDERII